MTTYEEERTRQSKVEDKLVKDRVERGIVKLQRRYGEGWVDKIDLAALRLESGAACVLGQLGGGLANENSLSYSKERDRLFPQDGDKPTARKADKEAGEHGFFAYTVFHYKQLQRVWEERIAELKAQRANGS
jgi:hypothetical protein